MTSEELNQKISELREPKPTMIPAGGDFYYFANGIAFTHSRVWLFYGGEWRNNADWTGSEEASAVLLEEMPEPQLLCAVWDGIKSWRCDPYYNSNIVKLDADRKRAVALAWLAWKTSTVQVVVSD